VFLKKERLALTRGVPLMLWRERKGGVRRGWRIPAGLQRNVILEDKPCGGKAVGGEDEHLDQHSLPELGSKRGIKRETFPPAKPMGVKRRGRFIVKCQEKVEKRGETSARDRREEGLRNLKRGSYTRALTEKSHKTGLINKENVGGKKTFHKLGGRLNSERIFKEYNQVKEVAMARGKETSFP